MSIQRTNRSFPGDFEALGNGGIFINVHRLETGKLLRPRCPNKTGNKLLVRNVVVSLAVVVGHVDIAHIGAKIAPPNPKDIKMMLPLRTEWEIVIKTAYDGQGKQKVIIITVINL